LGEILVNPTASVTTQAAVKFKNKTLDKPTTPNYNIREDFG
jgi:hypothetical protein